MVQATRTKFRQSSNAKVRNETSCDKIPLPPAILPANCCPAIQILHRDNRIHALTVETIMPTKQKLF